MKDKKLTACDNCGSVVPCSVYNSHEYISGVWTPVGRRLCMVCACTFLSRTSDSPADIRHIKVAIATLTNALVDALEVREKFEAILDANSSWEGEEDEKVTA